MLGYLKGFDIKGMSQYVDHFNFMSYDIHGTWDGNSEYTSSVVNPHTNISGRYSNLVAPVIPNYTKAPVQRLRTA
jgi:GH18 family chitinase